jgi:hypothetical protein
VRNLILLLAVVTVTTCSSTQKRDDRGGGRKATAGGLVLTGRALVAVPRDDHGVFLTWRFLEQDGATAQFSIERASAAAGPFTVVGTAGQTTTFRDKAGPGTFHYRVSPTSGALVGQASNVASVTTAAKGRDWVEILPAMRGRSLQFADRHFADTDGDGELELVTYFPRAPNYRGGTAPESYKVQVFDLLDDRAPRWTFDTGMGLQREPHASGDFRMDWDYEWTFKPVAWDVDGDARAEIITLAKRNGRYQYVVLRDAGDSYQELGAMDSPIPVGIHELNNRHFPFFARLGGPHHSFLLQAGTYDYWEMWAYDWNGHGFDPRWHVKSTEPGFKGNRSSSHGVIVMDLDGDGLDEINNGATTLGSDGRVLWSANQFFTASSHIDGTVIDDIDPRNPGLETMMHEERTFIPAKAPGDRYALYDARSGRPIWTKHAPGTHLQLNIAANLTGGSGLDILGTWGGHKPTGGFANTFDGGDLPFPFTEMPINGDRMWSIDWDGNDGHQIWFNFTKVYGQQAKLLYELDLGDAPAGTVIPRDPDKMYHFWFNVDLVGDHREDIPMQMADGSVRVYLNTNDLTTRKKSKWQSHSYQMMQAPGAYRTFIAAHD